MAERAEHSGSGDGEPAPVQTWVTTTHLLERLRDFDESAWDEVCERFRRPVIEYGKKVPEIRTVTDWMDMQRGYNESVWSNVQESMKARGDLLRETYEQANELITAAFAAEPPEKPSA